MKPSIEHVRELAAKNAAMLNSAKQSHENILDAADGEAQRLQQRIYSVDRAAVMTDEDEAENYMSTVLERAKLQRLSSERNA